MICVPICWLIFVAAALAIPAERTETNADRFRRGLPPLPPKRRHSHLQPRAPQTSLLANPHPIIARTGYLKVVSADGFEGYVSKIPSEGAGVAEITRNTNDALLVNFNSHKKGLTNKLDIKVAGLGSLGGIVSSESSSADIHAQGSNYAFLGLVQSNVDEPLVSPNSFRDDQAAASAIWDFNARTAHVSPHWFGSSQSARLKPELVYDFTQDFFALTGNRNAFSKAHKSDQVKGITLLFEPVLERPAVPKPAFRASKIPVKEPQSARETSPRQNFPVDLLLPFQVPIPPKSELEKSSDPYAFLDDHYAKEPIWKGSPKHYPDWIRNKVESNRAKAEAASQSQGAASQPKPTVRAPINRPAPTLTLPSRPRKGSDSDTVHLNFATKLLLPHEVEVPKPAQRQHAPHPYAFLDDRYQNTGIMAKSPKHYPDWIREKVEAGKAKSRSELSDAGPTATPSPRIPPVHGRRPSFKLLEDEVAKDVAADWAISIASTSTKPVEGAPTRWRPPPLSLPTRARPLINLLPPVPAVSSQAAAPTSTASRWSLLNYFSRKKPVTAQSNEI